MGRHFVYQENFFPHLLQRTPACSSHGCVVPCTTSSSYLRNGMATAVFTYPHIYVCHDGHKSSLTRPYEGPFCVVRHLEKHFTLDFNGKLKEVIVDRLKPAKLTRDPDTLISASPEDSSLLPSSFTAHSPSLLSRDRACSPELTAQDDTLAHPPTTTKTGGVTSTLG